MRKRTILLGVTAAVVAAAPASAEPTRTGTVGPSSPSYAWDGGPGSSFGVNIPGLGGLSSGLFGCREDVADCEENLIKVEAPGKLTVTAKADDTSKDAIDLYLYPSDSSGEYDDSEDDLADGEGASATGDEKIVIQADPGYYMAQVRFFDAMDDTYKGSAVLSGFPVPPPPPVVVAETPEAAPPPPPPPPAAAPPAAKPSKRAACTKKAKKIKNKRKRAKALKRCKKM